MIGIWAPQQINKNISRQSPPHGDRRGQRSLTRPPERSRRKKEDILSTQLGRAVETRGDFVGAASLTLRVRPVSRSVSMFCRSVQVTSIANSFQLVSRYTASSEPLSGS